MPKKRVTATADNAQKPKNPRGGKRPCQGNITDAERLRREGEAKINKSKGDTSGIFGWLGRSTQSTLAGPEALTATECSIVSKLLARISSGISSIVATVVDTISNSISSCVKSEMCTLRIFFRQESEKLKSEYGSQIQDVEKRRAEFERRLECQKDAAQVANRRWMATLISGNHICVPCSGFMHLAAGQGVSMKCIPWLSQNGGVEYKSKRKFQKQVLGHERSLSHQTCVDLSSDSAACPIQAAIAAQHEQGKMATENLMKITLDNAHKYRAFLDYESLVALVDDCGGEVGDWLHSRETSKQMAGTMYDGFFEQFIAYVTEIDAATGHRRHVGSAADKVSDKIFKQWQISCGRMNKVGTPFVFIISMRKMGETAKGVDCFRELRGSQGEMKMMPSQCRTYAFDGEAVYSGEGTTVPTVKSLLKKDAPSTEVIHDPPDSCELLKEQMHEALPYIYDIHELIRQVYSYFSAHGKKLDGMEKLASEMGIEWKQLHYIFEIRFVESEYNSICNFMCDYAVIIAAFQAVVEKAKDDVAMDVAQVKHWLRRMLQFKFVAVCLVLLDSDKQFKIFSKATQSDAALVIDYPTINEKFLAALGRCSRGCLGSHTKRNLASLKSGKYAGVKLRGLSSEISVAELSEPDGIHPDEFEVDAIVSKKKVGRGWSYFIKWKDYADSENSWVPKSRIEKTAKALVEAYERGDSVEAQQSASRAARAANRQAFADNEEEAEMDITVEAMASAIEARLEKYACVMTATLIDQFATKLPVPTIMTQLRMVFDFRRMPLNDTPSDNSKLLAWSDGQIDAMVESHFSDLDASYVKDQALQVRLWVRENQSDYMESVEVLGEDGDTLIDPSTKKPVLKQRLKICGPGSIMETLFTRHDTLFPCSIQSYLYIADYMIAYCFNQSHTERAGKNMTSTKTPDRASLGDISFKQLVWLSFNAPPIYQINFRPFVERWIKDQVHRLAAQKDGNGSKVIERKKNITKTTILH